MSSQSTLLPFKSATELRIAEINQVSNAEVNRSPAPEFGDRLTQVRGIRHTTALNGSYAGSMTVLCVPLSKSAKHPARSMRSGLSARRLRTAKRDNPREHL